MSTHPGSPPLNIAGLQVTPRAWDKEGNFAKLESFARQAAS